MDVDKLSVQDKRVRWHCRRGMKELDVLLESYFDTHYAAADPAEKKSFRLLLEHDDPTLWHWLRGAGEAEDPRLEAVVERIRSRC